MWQKSSHTYSGYGYFYFSTPPLPRFYLALIRFCDCPSISSPSTSFLLIPPSTLTSQRHQPAQSEEAVRVDVQCVCLFFSKSTVDSRLYSKSNKAGTVRSQRKWVGSLRWRGVLIGCLNRALSTQPHRCFLRSAAGHYHTHDAMRVPSHNHTHTHIEAYVSRVVLISNNWWCCLTILPFSPFFLKFLFLTLRSSFCVVTVCCICDLHYEI